jgi:hypothetical protein
LPPSVSGGMEQSGSVVERRAGGRCAPGAIRSEDRGTASVVDDETGAPVFEKADKCVGAIDWVRVLLARVVELRAHHVAARRRPRKHAPSLLVTLLHRGKRDSAEAGQARRSPATSPTPTARRLRGLPAIEEELLADDLPVGNRQEHGPVAVKPGSAAEAGADDTPAHEDVVVPEVEQFPRAQTGSRPTRRPSAAESERAPRDPDTRRRSRVR